MFPMSHITIKVWETNPTCDILHGRIMYPAITPNRKLKYPKPNLISSKNVKYYPTKTKNNVNQKEQICFLLAKRIDISANMYIFQQLISN